MLAKELSAIAHELGFWRGFIDSPRFETWISKDPTPDLGVVAAEFLSGLDSPRVLDVGSGPVSILRGTVDDVVATDPLAELYALFFDYRAHDIARPIGLPGEELAFVEEFDVAHCSNALDHSQDPAKVLENMFAAVRPGGHVVVHGFTFEAAANRGKGFHQWDMCIVDGAKLVAIDRQGVPHDLGEADLTDVRDTVNGRGWFTWIAEKR